MGNINMHERVATGRALGILGNLAHFRHSFISLYQSIITKGGSKNKYDNIELLMSHCKISHIRFKSNLKKKLPIRQLI